MASSGTFTSGRYGNSYGPWLTLAWTQVSQSVANNTTTLDLTLRFHWDRNIYYVFHNRSGSLQGNSYTYSGSASGTSGSLVLRTQRVTISHNSNGSRSVTLSGNITGLGLTFSGNRINTMSVSGTANLNTIPRASTLSAFSFNAHLKNGVANQINYTIDRKSTAFRHQIQLRDGNTVLRTWDNVDSNSASTLALTATEVNTLLNRMSSSTTRSYTLRVATRSGVNGGWIGSAVSRNATATVHADVKPTVSAVTLSQTGNPVSTHTLQGFSKIKASFTRSAGYGATISSSSIQVRRRSGGADSQTINSNSGTTANAVALNGVYEARGTARDSRGRTTNTAWATITVTPYSAPTITNFSAERSSSNQATVSISRATTHTVLGTSNHLSYSIQRRQGTGAWANVSSGATGSITTSGATGSATSTGNSATQSYEFRLVVTDKLGRRAESLQSVSTQRVVLDIHKNEGVGIGKIHEEGALDVGGDIRLAPRKDLGETSIGPESQINFTRNTELARLFHRGADQNFGIFIGTEGHARTRLRWNKSFWNFEGINDTGVRINGRPIMESGSNSNGNWIRFYDGAQICWLRKDFAPSSMTSRTDTAQGLTIYGTRHTWTYPQAFSELPTVSAGGDEQNYGRLEAVTSWGTSNSNATVGWESLVTKGSNIVRANYIAIGRWR